MDREAWHVLVQGVAKKSNITERLNWISPHWRQYKIWGIIYLSELPGAAGVRSCVGLSWYLSLFFSASQFSAQLLQEQLFFFFFFFFLIFFPFIFISWRLITLQDCSGFCHALTWVSHGFTMYSPSWSPLPPPSPPHPSGSSQCTRPEHLSHASNLGWWSVSPLIVYLFQEYFLNISLALKFLTWKFFLEKKHQCLISAIFSILEWKLSIWKWINSVKQWCYGFMKCSTSIFY